MNKMKNTILTSFAVLLMLTCQASAIPCVDILSIDVIPNQPSNTDLITFSISGWAANTPSWVDYDQFSQNGTSLQLDLYVNQSGGRYESYWNYSKQIQPLVQGIYSLEVRAFNNNSDVVYDPPGTLEDTYNVNFTVVPEPATVFLLGLGLPFFRTLSAWR